MNIRRMLGLMDDALFESDNRGRFGP